MNNMVLSPIKHLYRSLKKCFHRLKGIVLKRIERDPKIVIPINGGFSSQMARYAIGEYFRKRGDTVVYDIEWFYENGRDELGKEARKWILPDCFPELDFHRISGNELNRYRDYYADIAQYVGKEEKIKAPAYVGGSDFDYLFGGMERHKHLFDWQGLYKKLSNDAKQIADEIIKENINGITTVGIHVRRGDMAVAGSYWKVLKADYFLEVLQRIEEKNQKLYFFSNGFDFVENYIVPFIKDKSIYLIKNNQDYEDMYLYTLCRIQVASQSSWGEYSYPFNSNEGKRLYMPVMSPKKPDEYSKLEEKGIVLVDLKDNMYEKEA